MKLKKNVKRIFLIILLLFVIGGGFYVYQHFLKDGKRKLKKAEVINEIKEYGYTLKSNQTKAYKKEFEKLAKILSKDEVDEEEYVKQLSILFLLDFYSLNNKLANTDVGGVEFVHSSAVANFITKAEDTLYKYVESNIYGNRKQNLPEVLDITIEDVEKTVYDDDSSAYQVNATWNYKEDLGYQTKATLTFAHEDKKLSLVEME